MIYNHDNSKLIHIIIIGDKKIKIKQKGKKIESYIIHHVFFFLKFFVSKETKKKKRNL